MLNHRSENPGIEALGVDDEHLAAIEVQLLRESAPCPHAYAYLFQVELHAIIAPDTIEVMLHVRMLLTNARHVEQIGQRPFKTTPLPRRHLSDQRLMLVLWPLEEPRVPVHIPDRLLYESDTW